jgi:hypothetical protein
VPSGVCLAALGVLEMHELEQKCGTCRVPAGFCRRTQLPNSAIACAVGPRRESSNATTRRRSGRLRVDSGRPRPHGVAASAAARRARRGRSVSGASRAGAPSAGCRVCASTWINSDEPSLLTSEAAVH